MKELKITDERVLKAAESCGTAKQVLKELFPEVFGKGKVPYDKIVLKVDNHEEYGGWDIHLYEKSDCGDKTIGYVTFEGGKVCVSRQSSEYRVEVKTGAMSDDAILFDVYRV